MPSRPQTRDARGPLREIFLVLPAQQFHNREIRRGIYQFALPRRPWIFFFIDQAPEAISRIRVRRGTCGIIGRFGRPDLAGAVRRLRLPAINIHGGTPMAGLPVVGPDSREIGRCAAQWLLEAGGARFAFRGVPSADFSDAILAGYREALKQAGHDVAVYAPPSAGRGGADGSADRLRWLKALPKPISIFCPEDILAHELGCMALQAKLRVPEDVALLGTNNDPVICLGVQPPLSSIRLPWQEVGFRAARLLAELMDGARPPAEPIRLGPPELVPRQSTPLFHCRDDVVERAMVLMRESVHAPMDMNAVARAIGVPRRLREKHFRAALNRTPLQEQNRQRIEEIKRRLREDDDTIERIADRCGFSGAVYLSQFFHRATGLSPGAYRHVFREHRDTR